MYIRLRKQIKNIYTACGKGNNPMEVTTYRRTICNTNKTGQAYFHRMVSVFENG